MAALRDLIFSLLLLGLCDFLYGQELITLVERKWRASFLPNKKDLLTGWSKGTSERPKYIAMATWNFGKATQAAYEFLSNNNGSAVDAVVEGCGYCEKNQCDFTVGYGGSPDENGETSLDAMVFDGVNMDVGAVGGLRRIKNAIGVARAVLDHTDHSVLVGDAATEFARRMGFKEESLGTNRSYNQWITWKNDNCQPNFWKEVSPDPRFYCGPYHPSLKEYCKPSSNLPFWPNICSQKKKNISNKLNPLQRKKVTITKKKKKVHNTISKGAEFNHDTIGQIVMDSTGAIATGTSSNGATHKIPGRMGDAAVPGAGGYADNRYGAAVATGNGDIMMRFSPSAAVVQRLKDNVSPEKATRQVINLIREKYPSFEGALLAMNTAGNFGAACSGITSFPFTVASSNVDDGRVRTYYIPCINDY